jgi:hypothetical protein
MGRNTRDGDKHIPTDVSSMDHKAGLTFPLRLAIVTGSMTLTIRIMEKKMMTIPRKKIAPIPNFVLKLRRPIRSRIGNSAVMVSVAMSMLVATQIALTASEVEPSNEASGGDN